MAIKIYSFIFVMWILMLIGGGLVVIFVGPFTLATDIDPIMKPIKSFKKNINPFTIIEIHP